MPNESTLGIYSLIQYCPNLAHREFCNIGVVLLIPETGFLEVKMGKDVSRVRRYFGEEAAKNVEWMKDLEASGIKNRGIKTREDLLQYANTRANHIFLSHITATNVREDPLGLLDKLVLEHVDTPIDQSYWENERSKLLRTSEPWDLVSCVRKMVWACDHLMRDHDCDCHGWESTDCAIRGAKEWLREVTGDDSGLPPVWNK